MTALRYTEDHEWVRLEDDGTATVGITHHAQESLGDIVYVELPEIDKSFAKDDTACVVESVKAAADVKMPVAAVVTAVNGALREDPTAINSDPTGKGWFMIIRPAQLADLDLLLDEAAYQALITGS